MEKLMNSLTDKDWGWWPFLFLRPAKGERMTTVRVAKMASYYGGLQGASSYLVFADAAQDFDVAEGVIYVLGFIALFFAFYKTTFAYFWNRRVERLQRELNDNSKINPRTPDSRLKFAS